MWKIICTIAPLSSYKKLKDKLKKCAKQVFVPKQNVVKLHRLKKKIIFYFWHIIL